MSRRALTMRGRGDLAKAPALPSLQPAGAVVKLFPGENFERAIRRLWGGRGNRVAIVDADPQRSAAVWAEPGRLPMSVVEIPLGVERAATDDEERLLAREWSAAVRGVAADVVIVDSPPHLRSAIGAVIGMCDLVVIPCGPSGLDIAATAETVALVREIRAARRSSKPAALLIPNRVDRRTAAGRELPGELADMGEPTAPAVCYRTAFSDAFNDGLWVGSIAPNSPAHREMQALAVAVVNAVQGLR